jgi:hypothetical protein
MKIMAAKNSILVLLFLVGIPFIVGCNKDDDNPNTKTFTYDFSTNQDGWLGGFADYSDADATTNYNLVFLRTTLPVPLNTSKSALKIGGTNYSDDLFMYIKKKIVGLEPNKTYKIKFDIEFASNAPTNQLGSGGPPDAVFMKVGATLIEPNSVLQNSDLHYRMNLDKGHQAIDGANMYNIGNIGVADNITQYTLISRNNSSRPFAITTNSSGEIWVIIGTDSGFESRTELFYNRITLTFN